MFSVRRFCENCNRRCCEFSLFKLDPVCFDKLSQLKADSQRLQNKQGSPVARYRSETANREWTGIAFLNVAFSLLFVAQLSYVNTQNLCMPFYKQFLRPESTLYSKFNTSIQGGEGCGVTNSKTRRATRFIRQKIKGLHTMLKLLL